MDNVSVLAKMVFAVTSEIITAPTVVTSTNLMCNDRKSTKL